MKKEWNEELFFSLAKKKREELLKSNKATKQIELQLLSEIVGQVFVSGKLPDSFTFVPPQRVPREEFLQIVKKVLHQLNIKCNSSKKMVSQYTINVVYYYYNPHY